MTPCLPCITHIWDAELRLRIFFMVESKIYLNDGAPLSGRIMSFTSQCRFMRWWRLQQLPFHFCIFLFCCFRRNNIYLFIWNWPTRVHRLNMPRISWNFSYVPDKWNMPFVCQFVVCNRNARRKKNIKTTATITSFVYCRCYCWLKCTLLHGMEWSRRDASARLLNYKLLSMAIF